MQLSSARWPRQTPAYVWAACVVQSSMHLMHKPTSLLTISNFLGGFFWLHSSFSVSHSWSGKLDSSVPLFNIWHIIFQSFFFSLSLSSCTQLPTCCIPASTSDVVMPELLNSQRPSCFQQQNPRWSWVLPQKFLIFYMRDGLLCCLVLPCC